MTVKGFMKGFLPTIGLVGALFYGLYRNPKIETRRVGGERGSEGRLERVIMSDKSAEFSIEERKGNFEEVGTERFGRTMNERPVELNYDAIEQIESSGNPRAYNRNSGARGLRQITPIVLKEWNQLHPNEQYSLEDLFDARINRKIGNWYLEERIPYYLKYYGLEDNVENRLASYNWGIGNVKRIGGIRRNMDILPRETRNYIEKYKQLTSGEYRK